MLLPQITKAVNTWLGAVAADKKMPRSIVALNVGLFEVPGGYNAYIIGSKTFDPANSDWATSEDYTPHFKYLKFEGWLYRLLTWRWFQSLLARDIRRYIAQNPTAGFSQVRHITIGFDDGDLEILK
jgi:hypothetical protein